MTYKIPSQYRGKEILSEWWRPCHPDFEYPDDFVEWVDSINSGWQNKKTYDKFELYREQARLWLLDKSTILDFHNELDQEEWLIEEIRRCKENSLYFCNKYGWVKEDKAEGGMLKYIAWEAQEVLLFLFDCGYSFLIGKARQIGFTTTMCLAGMKRVNFFKSYFIKFVTYTEEKGIEIFRDKVKWTYNKIPDHLAKEVKNWTDKVMSFDVKGVRKGREEGSGQRFEVTAPSITAINGGSPSCTLVDEVGLMEIFGEMMAEARPALFKYNPETRKMTMQQQFIGWGTSGDMDKGGAVFESLFMFYLGEWRARRFESGIIPLFFNAYARRGVDHDFLMQQKKEAESKKDTPKGDKFLVQFYQAYPIEISDMFIRKTKTLVPRTMIDRRMREIVSLGDQIEYGRFEPIFDKSRPTPDLFCDYKIVGAQWVRMREGDESVTACIINHPPAGEFWKNRYYQGTDPINSETGYSNMSSAIWDAYSNTVASVVFDRQRNFKETYLQCLLQSLYYDQVSDGGVPELLENNIGDMYLDFQEVLGFSRKIVPNTALPEYMQTNTKWFGISNRTNTAPRIIAKLEELLDAYGENINVAWFWNQLRTFVEKDLRSPNSQRQTRYQAGDTRYDRDDTIFAIVFAYINAISHAKKEPVNLRSEATEKKINRRFVMNQQTNWRKRLCEVDSNGNIVRML